MMETPVKSLLQKSFSATTREEWKKIAMQETGGKDPYEFLSWRGTDGMVFLPYYDASDVADLHTAPGRAPKGTYDEPISKKRHWYNLPEISADNAQEGNSRALENLASGADGVLFDLQKVKAAAPDLLLKNIEWPYCMVSFTLKDEHDLTQPLTAYIERKFDPDVVRGALFWESVPKKNDQNFLISYCRNFRSLGLKIPTASPTEEISEALLRGVKTYDMFADSIHKQQVLASICFSMSAESLFLENVAKLRALRMLWQQIAQSYGHNDYNYEDLHVHVRSLSAEDDQYAPHQNMQKGTFAALAAVLGGCDSLTIMSAQDSPHVSRWARNVSAILREEAILDQDHDPLAGSYVIEALTHSIAREAWSRFQTKWKNR